MPSIRQLTMSYLRGFSLYLIPVNVDGHGRVESVPVWARSKEKATAFAKRRYRPSETPLARNLAGVHQAAIGTLAALEQAPTPAHAAEYEDVPGLVNELRVLADRLDRTLSNASRVHADE